MIIINIAANKDSVLALILLYNVAKLEHAQVDARKCRSSVVVLVRRQRNAGES